MVPTGVAIALPDGYAAFVHPRSGLARAVRRRHRQRAGHGRRRLPRRDQGAAGQPRPVGHRPARARRPDRPARRAAGRAGAVPRGRARCPGSARGEGGLRLHRRLRRPAAGRPAGRRHGPTTSRGATVSAGSADRTTGRRQARRRRRPRRGRAGDDRRDVRRAAAQPRPAARRRRRPVRTDPGTSPRSTTPPATGRVDLGGLLAARRAKGSRCASRPTRPAGDVVAVTLVLDDGALQLQPFAAPRSEGIWDEVRAEIRAGITQRGRHRRRGRGAARHRSCAPRCRSARRTAASRAAGPVRRRRRPALVPARRAHRPARRRGRHRRRPGGDVPRRSSSSAAPTRWRPATRSRCTLPDGAAEPPADEDEPTDGADDLKPVRARTGDHRDPLTGAPAPGDAPEPAGYPGVMGNRSGESLRRTVSRLATSAKEHEAQELQKGCVALGAAPVTDLPRARASSTVAGTLRTVTLRPRAGVPALEAELYDGTGVDHPRLARPPADHRHRARAGRSWRAAGSRATTSSGSSSTRATSCGRPAPSEPSRHPRPWRRRSTPRPSRRSCGTGCPSRSAAAAAWSRAPSRRSCSPSATCSPTTCASACTSASAWRVALLALRLLQRQTVQFVVNA